MRALNCNDKLLNLSDQINLSMLHFFNDGSIKRGVYEEWNQGYGLGQTEVLAEENDDLSDRESSPSFFTDELMDEGLYLGDSFMLTPEQSSVSEFGQSVNVGLWEQRFEEAQRQHNHKLSVLDQDVSYLPSHQSSTSYKPSIEILSSGLSQKNLSKHSQSFKGTNIQSKENFLPEIKSLVDQINFLENDLYSMAAEYLRMKTFCSTLIRSIKTLLSEDVGRQLQEYVQGQFKNCQLDDFQAKNYQDNFPSKIPSKFSHNLLTKIFSQQSSNSLDQQSRQISKNIEQIFTLGQSKFKLDNNSNQKPNSKHINCKSTKKKTTQNQKKKTSQNDKENFYNQIEIIQQIPHKKQDKPSQAKYSNLTVQNMKNQSMKFLIRDYANSGNSTTTSTPRNIFNFSSAKNSVLATELLCEVCGECFGPNEFVKHVSNCPAFRKQDCLKSTQKLAFNYTIMMDKLFGMRKEIECQIKMLCESQQKRNEKAERQRLRKKLQEDLEKVSRIIQEKQRLMQVHLSKNIEMDFCCTNDNPPNQVKISSQLIQARIRQQNQ